MSHLLREHDEIMIRIRSQFEQSGWFSRLFFPSEMQRFLLQFFISSRHRAGSSTKYEAQYRGGAAFGFCEQYHHFITDNSLIGRFRRWLFDFLPAFNTTTLMNMWRFTNDQELGEDEFTVLVANPDAPAFQRDILVFKQALANDDSKTLREVYARYLRDIVIRSPLSSSLEGFAALLIASCNKGLAYNRENNCYGEAYEARKKMFDILSENLPAFAGITASLQRLNARIHFANLITVEQVVKLFQDNALDKWVNGLNALHVQTMNPNTNRSALHENPDLIKLLLNHPEPESLSQGLVVLWQRGLCIKTNLLKKGEVDLTVLDKLGIRLKAVASTAERMTNNIEFYSRGITTEAGAIRAFERNLDEEVISREKAWQNSKKFDSKWNKFRKLTHKYQLPTALQMSDFETSGLNVLRLAHHPYPDRVVNALGKFHFRDAAFYADERACVVGSANGWGFALGDKSLDFFNYVKSKGLQTIYHQLLDYSQIFLHKDVMPYWEKIQDNHLSPVHFFEIYQLCIHGLKEGQDSARSKVIDYLQNISDKQNNYSLMTETALTLMFMHGGKILDKKLDEVIVSLMMGVSEYSLKNIECIKRLEVEQFIDAETDISASQLLALTWIALQKVFAKNETRSLNPSIIMNAQLSAFQEAHTAARFAERGEASHEASTSDVGASLVPR